MVGRRGRVVLGGSPPPTPARVREFTIKSGERVTATWDEGMRGWHYKPPVPSNEMPEWSNRGPDVPAALRSDGEPQFGYAPTREEAQRLLDESYLKKYRVKPVRWWTPHPNSAPATMGLVRYSYALGIFSGFAIYRIVEALT